jgi:hypothetical protein
MHPPRQIILKLGFPSNASQTSGDEMKCSTIIEIKIPNGAETITLSSIAKKRMNNPWFESKNL